MALRDILTVNNPQDEIRLRKKSRPVAEVDSHIRTLIEDMVETLHNTPIGIGLAAPQVGILRRVVVIDEGNGVIILVNPEIIESEGTQKVVEGCLSVPDRNGELIRPARVTVKALDENGKEFTVTGEGQLAKCLCHEIDHLDGILFTDRII